MRVGKINISIGTPEPLVGMSTKVTGEVKDRFQSLIKKGHSHDELIKSACELYEAHYAELESNTKSGKTKKHFTQMQRIK